MKITRSSGAAALVAIAGATYALGVLCAERARGEAALVLKAPQTLEVGLAAPDFSLPDQDGKMHHLADYRGKTVILAFYPKDFTGG